MILSASATHALRALACLATHDGDGAMLGRDLARKVKLPPDYLAKVLATLTRNGVLEASRGVKGGYRLARPARKIKLIDVVLPFEGKRAKPGCLLRPERPCRSGSHCAAHQAWGGVKDAYIGFLERTTLADLADGG